ncbi:MAG: UDP-N-acetylmuramoyl-L-alanyl-D-glutamate--2,6-diaminopimelate ligase [Minisyncoccia bacterium]
MNKILRQIKKIIPTKIFSSLQPIYHWKLAFLAALIYRFPSRKIKVIAITGTKGKTSTAEIINAILEEAGFKTALAGTLRFKIGDDSKNNMYKMTLPGRFFVQKFLRQAVNAKCEYVILEITSQAVVQYRHKFINLDALIFTNLAPEHIESHGSYENYLAAKLEIAKALEKSKKPNRIIVSNSDDKEGNKFLNINVPTKLPYSIKDVEPFEIKKEGCEFTWGGQKITSPLSGLFNIYNILAAATFAKSQNVSDQIIKRAVEKFSGIRGRVEKIDEGQNFTVIVDYAHTPDSLEKLYEVFQSSRIIAVLGNTGGGRDKWKRIEMANIAEKHASHIILTDEDPYDDDPRGIVEDMAKEITEKPLEIIMDRRQAIATAFKEAKPGDAVLITGKGTDPYIMRANGKKEAWNDAEVAREELRKLKK